MISVCMATYNGEKYIREQMDSILQQLGEGDELIISDDLSSDKTVEIIKSYKDKRIKLYIHGDNHGFVRNFENALVHADGDIIFLSDQDDIWMPDKVKVTIAALANCDFTVSDCITINENEQVPHTLLPHSPSSSYGSHVHNFCSSHDEKTMHFLAALLTTRESW